MENLAQMRHCLIHWLKDNAGLLALLAIAFVVYASSFSGGLVVDDVFIIKDNPNLDGNNLARFFSHGFWENTTSPDEGAAMYRPFVLVYFWLAHKLWGAAPLGYHVVLVLLHLANVCLVYAVARRLFTASAVAATIGAAIFALHPTHVESVAWISGAPDPLALFFMLAALLAHHAFAENREKWRYLVLAACCFQLALWSKEVAIAFPLVAVAYDLTFRRKINWPSTILYAALVAGYMAARSLVLSVSGLLSNLNLTQFPKAFDLTLGYAEWLAFPWQVPLYLQPPQHQLASIIGWCAVALTLMAVIIAWRMSGHQARRTLVFSVAWMAVFSWTAVLMMFYLEGYYSARFLYVPTAGMAFFAAVFYDRLVALRANLKIPAVIFSVFVFAAYGVVTIREIAMWHDNLTVYQRMTKVAPEGTVGFISLGYVLIDKGDYAGAEENFLIALQNARIPRVRAGALVALGTVTGMRNDLVRSESYLNEAVRIAPRNFLAWAGLGNLAWMQGRLNDAIPLYEKSLAINPQNYEATMNLANVYEQLGQAERAASIRNAMHR